MCPVKPKCPDQTGHSDGLKPVRLVSICTQVRQRWTPTQRRPWLSSVLTTQCGEQVQQADENVIQRNKQRDCGQNIIALTTVNDCAGLEQDHRTGKQDKTGRQCQLQRRHSQEQVGYEGPYDY